MRDVRIPLSRENDRQLYESMQEHGLGRYTDYELIATFLDDLKAGDTSLLDYLDRTRIRSNAPGDVLGEEDMDRICTIFDLYLEENVTANRTADSILHTLYRDYEKRCTDMFLIPRSLPTFLENAEVIYQENRKKALSPSEQSK